MSISVNIHPKSFEAQSHHSGTTWISIEAGDSAAVVFLTPELCDELIMAATAAKQLLAAAARSEGK